MIKHSLLVAVAILSATSCSSSRSNKGSLPVATSNTTTDANGVVTYSFDPSSTVEQTVNINDSTLKGTSVVIAPGTLSVLTGILVEEGASASGNITTALGGTEAPLAASPTVIIRTADPSVIPRVPLTISLPLGTIALTLAQDKLVVFALYYTPTGLKSAIFPPDKITVEGGKAKFSTAYFGQFQLGYLSTIPAVLETNATQAIVSKREASVKQSVYILGMKKIEGSLDQAGILKDGFWNALEVTSAGAAGRPWSMLYHKGKLYIGGGMESPHAPGTYDYDVAAGVWVDGKWNALPMPVGRTRCYDVFIAFDAQDRLHVNAYCGDSDMATGKSFSTEWIDGVGRTVEGSSNGIASDNKGNILRTVPAGYLINNEDLHSLPAQPNSQAGGKVVVAPNGDIYVSAWSTGMGIPPKGYWLNDVWVSETLDVSVFVFPGGSDPIKLGRNDRQPVLVRGGKETLLECRIDPANSTYNSDVYGAAIDREGVVHSVGICPGSIAYWKDGVAVDIGAIQTVDVAIF